MWGRKNIGVRVKFKRSVLLCCKGIKLMQDLVTWVHSHTHTCTQIYTQHTYLHLFIYVHIFSKTSSLKITEGNVYKTQQPWMGQWHKCQYQFNASNYNTPHWHRLRSPTIAPFPIYTHMPIIIDGKQCVARCSGPWVSRLALWRLCVSLRGMWFESLAFNVWFMSQHLVLSFWCTNCIFLSICPSPKERQKYLQKCRRCWFLSEAVLPCHSEQWAF